MRPEKIHPQADEEFVQAALRYAQENPELGKRFHDEIIRLIADVVKAPTLYRYIDEDHQRHFSTRFKYAIIYKQEAEYIHILAIMHMHRDPNYWRSRTA